MEKKSFRIRTVPGGEDNYLNVKLDQKYDYLEILSLKISQENFYREFSADYGVLVGRVIANSGVGVPNANVSIFVPLSNDDANNVALSSLYPYTQITDKNSQGISYNLISPRLELNVGSFPNKQQFLDDDTYIEVYEKYYKYTTKTNDAGDYMIFGVPIGSNNIHMDMDLSNIGTLSFTPTDLIASGISESLFIKSSSDTYSFPEGTDLESLPQIIIQNSSVDIKALWGNVDENEIGITRYDFKVSINANPVATYIVNYGVDVFTANASGVDLVNYNGRGDGITGTSGDSFNAPGHMQRVFPFIDDGTGANFGEPEMVFTKYSEDYSTSEIVDYVTVIKNAQTTAHGVLIAYLPCDQNKFITDEFGDSIPSPDGNSGIGTTGRYSLQVNLDGGTVPDYEAYWSYLVQYVGDNLNRATFKFDAKRIYSSNMRFRQFSTNKGASPNPFALRETLRPLEVNYPDFNFAANDWVNCFLYFGRVGNEDDTTSQKKTPDDLYVTIGSRRFYAVETRFIDITDYYTNLAVQPNHYVETPDFNPIYKDISVTVQDRWPVDLQLPEPSPSRNNNKIFILGLRTNVNNFSTFAKNVKR